MLLAKNASAAVSILAGPITNPANGQRYYLLSSASWTESESAAQALLGADAHLVTINDQAEQNWVYNTFYGLGYTQYFWIGLSDAAVEGTFVWASGEPFIYDNWKPGEPNNFFGNEHYVHFEPDGLWNDNEDLPYGGGVVFGIVEVRTPAIASLVPQCCSTRGSDQILITGANFDATATVRFGDVTATQVHRLDASQLLVTTPPHAAGYVDITITNPSGASAVLTQGFLFVPPPVIDRIFPESGSWRGGTGVAIIGSNFWVGAVVFFGSVRAREVHVVDRNTILAITRPMWPGTIDVEVRNPPPCRQSSVGQATPIKFTFLPSDGHDGGCNFVPGGSYSLGQIALLCFAIAGLIGFKRRRKQR